MKKVFLTMAAASMLLMVSTLSSCKKEPAPAEQTTPTPEQSADPSQNPAGPDDEKSQDPPQRTDVSEDYVYIDAALAELIKTVDPSDFLPLMETLNKYDMDYKGAPSLDAVYFFNTDAQAYVLNWTQITGIYTLGRAVGATEPEFTYAPADGKIEIYVPVLDAPQEPVLHILLELEGETGWIKIGEQDNSGKTFDKRVPVPAHVSGKMEVGTDVLAEWNVNIDVTDGLGDMDYMQEVGKTTAKLSGRVRVLDYVLNVNDVLVDVDLDAMAGAAKGNIGLSKQGKAVLGIDIDVKGSMLMTSENFNVSGDISLVTTDKLCINLNAKNLLVGPELINLIEGEEFPTEEAAAARAEKVMDALDVDIYYGNRVYGHDKRNAEIFLYPIQKSELETLIPGLDDGTVKATDDGSGDPEPEPEPEIEYWLVVPMYAFQSENFETAWLLYPDEKYLITIAEKFPETQSALLGFINKLQKLMGRF